MKLDVKQLKYIIEEVITEQETEARKRHRQRSNKYKDEGRKEYPSNAATYRGPKQRHIDAFGKGSYDMLSLGRGIVEEEAIINPNDETMKGFVDLFDALGYTAEDNEEPNVQPEEEELTEKEKKLQVVKGNRFHDQNGRFQTGEKAGSDSIGNAVPAKAGRIRGQARWTGNQSRWVSTPCGAYGRKVGRYVRCKDGKKYIPESLIRVPARVTIPTKKDGSVDLYKVSLLLAKRQDEIRKLNHVVSKLSKRKDCKALSIGDAVKMIRALTLATKGKSPNDKKSK